MQTSGASRREVANAYLELEQRHCEPIGAHSRDPLARNHVAGCFEN
jgi:hypothetical protein